MPLKLHVGGTRRAATSSARVRAGATLEAMAGVPKLRRLTLRSATKPSQRDDFYH